MAKSKLEQEDFERAAHELLCDVPAIQAVAEVEAPHGGFLSDGRPTILFERHKFHQFTRGAHYEQHPDICNPKRGGYVGGIHEWARYNKALELNPQAAMLSTSWGRFQIMGFNYLEAGYPDVEAFVRAMHESEARHLDAFVRLLKSKRWDDEIRSHDWKTFARLYNGPDYREHQYDDRLQAAYLKWQRAQPSTADLKQAATWSNADAAPARSPEAPAVDATPAAVISRPEDEPIQASQNGGKAWLTTLASWVTAGSGAVWAAIHDKPQLIYVAAGLVALVTLLAFVRWTVTDLHRQSINSRPDRYNVR